MDSVLIMKRDRIARYATKAPRLEALTAPGPSPKILPESAPGIPVLIEAREGREFRRLDKSLMGAARKVRFGRDPRSGVAFTAWREARAALVRAESVLAVETADSARLAFEAALAAEGRAHDGYLAAQLGL
jgi:hypothetical protein